MRKKVKKSKSRDVTKSKYLTRYHIGKKYGEKNRLKQEKENFIYVPVRKDRIKTKGKPHDKRDLILFPSKGVMAP